MTTRLCKDRVTPEQREVPYSAAKADRQWLEIQYLPGPIGEQVTMDIYAQQGREIPMMYLLPRVGVHPVAIDPDAGFRLVNQDLPPRLMYSIDLPLEGRTIQILHVPDHYRWMGRQLNEVRLKSRLILLHVHHRPPHEETYPGRGIPVAAVVPGHSWKRWLRRFKDFAHIVAARYIDGTPPPRPYWSLMLTNEPYKMNPHRLHALAKRYMRREIRLNEDEIKRILDGVDRDDQDALIERLGYYVRFMA